MPIVFKLATSGHRSVCSGATGALRRQSSLGAVISYRQRSRPLFCTLTSLLPVQSRRALPSGPDCSTAGMLLTLRTPDMLLRYHTSHVHQLFNLVAHKYTMVPLSQPYHAASYCASGRITMLAALPARALTAHLALCTLLSITVLSQPSINCQSHLCLLQVAPGSAHMAAFKQLLTSCLRDVVALPSDTPFGAPAARSAVAAVEAKCL